MQNIAHLMQTFWSKLKSNLRIRIFDYDFIFSVSDYFLISPDSDFLFSPSAEGTTKKTDVPLIWYFLNFLFYRDLCLFSFERDDIDDFYHYFLSEMSPLIYRKLEQSLFLGIRKYERSLYDFIHQNKRNFNKDTFRFMWLAYKDKFDVEFLQRNINNPLFLHWYIENMRKDSREKTIEKELDMYIINPQMFTELKKQGKLSSMDVDDEERKDFLDTIQEMAKYHKEQIERERKKKKK